MHKFLIAAVASMLPMAANATTVIATYRGIISSGVDTYGAFGAAGSLNGAAVTLNFTLTLPTPGARLTDDGTNRQYFGGAGYGAYAPISPVSATVTINGVVRDVAGQDSGITSRSDEANGFDTVEFGAFDDFTIAGGDRTIRRAQAFIFSDVNELLQNRSLTQPFSYVPQAGDTAAGQFYLYRYNIGTSQEFEYSFGDFTVTSINIVNNGAVPEPAQWALMIGGFGLVGAASRRRRLAVA